MSTKIINQIKVLDTNTQNSGVYPLGADAANVYITNNQTTGSVTDVIGDINLTINGSIAKQLNKIEDYLKVVKNAITYTEDLPLSEGKLALGEIDGVKNNGEITLNEAITNKITDVKNELIETIKTTPITYYVATNGNDQIGSGASDKPFATVNHALEAGASIVCLFPGDYDQDINLSLAKTPNITITTAIKEEGVDRRVRFIGPDDNKFSFTFANQSGQQWLYDTYHDENGACSCLKMFLNAQSMEALKAAIGKDNCFLFLNQGEDELINYTELNSLQDKHPSQRLSYKQKENGNFSLFRSDIIGLKRIPVSKPAGNPIDYDAWKQAIKQAVAKADYPAFEVCIIEEKNEFDIFVNHHLGDLSNKTGYFLKTDKLLITQENSSVSNRNAQSLILDGIEAYHRRLSLKDLLKVSCLNCKIEGSYGTGGGFSFNQVKNVFCNKCEVSFCGSGFNIHGANASRIAPDAYKKIQSSILLTDCWIHDIATHGIMTQEGCVTTVIGGLVEYCGAGGHSGVMTANGGNCTCYNVYSRNNYYNFLSSNSNLLIGTSYDTPSQTFCSNCISENASSTGYYCNTVKKDSEGHDIPTTVGYMTLSNCISQNDKRAINPSTHKIFTTHKILNLITLKDDDINSQAMTMSLFDENYDIEAGE